MKPIFLNVAILFVLSIFVMACSGNSGTGSTCSSDEAQQMKVATSAGADVEDLVEDAMDEADDLVKEQESSIVGKIPTLLKRRLAAIRYVNEWMEKHQLENANDKDALEKNKDLLSKNDQAFKLLEEKYKKEIDEEVAKLAGKDIPLELDKRYFISGSAKVKEAGETLIYFSYDLKASELRKGYYRVVIEYLDEAGSVIEKTESLSANIRPSDAGPVCKFDQSGDVDDLELAKNIRITLRLEDE